MATAVEYGLIAALIGVVIIGGVTALGPQEKDPPEPLHLTGPLNAQAARPDYGYDPAADICFAVFPRDETWVPCTPKVMTLIKGSPPTPASSASR